MNGRKKMGESRGTRYAKHFALPPHSWETPKTSAGEANKTFLVALISILAVVILGALLFFGARFVGKAVEVALPPGFGGVTSTIDLPKAAGEEVILPLGVTLPATKKSVAFEVELKYSSEILEFIRIDSLVPWDNVFQRVTQGEATVKLERATINFTDAIQGKVVLADAVFLVLPGQQLSTAQAINITALTVLDLDDPAGNLVQNIAQASGQVNPPVTEPTLAFGFTGQGTLALTLLLPPEKEVLSLYFELTSSNFTGICAGTITNLPWNEFPEQGCAGNVLRVGDATLNNTKAGTVPLAEFSFPLPAAGITLQFNFQKIDVYDQNGIDLFPAGQVFTVTVPVVPVNPCASIVCPTQSTTCTDGFTANCTPACNPANGLCGTCTPNCAGHGCSTGQTRSCNSNVGICESGTQTCSNGQFGACLKDDEPVILPATEICDGLDNDCDASTDEGCPLTLTSPEFSKGGVIPIKYTCTGRNETNLVPPNPPLLVSNIPAGTKSLALFLVDADKPIGGQPTTVHWAVFNIPVPANNPQTPAIDESTFVVIPENYPGASPGILQAQNDVTQEKKYAPPCPPAGENHRYRFTAYALRLADVLSIPSINSIIGVNAQKVINPTVFSDSAGGNIVQDADLIGFYPTKPRPTAGAPAPSGGGSGSGGRGGGRVGWNCPKQWSACTNGNEQRICTDMFRPDSTRTETRPCVVSITAPPPAPPKPAPAIQPPKPAPPEPQPVLVVPPSAAVKAPEVQKPAPLAPLLSFLKASWQKYKVYIIAIPSALLVIITLILSIHHFRKPKPVYNIEELKGWIKAEKAMGTSDEHVKAILAQNTGWSKEEIDEAFKELLPPAAPATPSPPPTG